VEDATSKTTAKAASLPRRVGITTAITIPGRGQLASLRRRASSVIRPALAMALSRVPPRNGAPIAQTGSATSAGAVVRSQVARKPAGATPTLSRQPPAAGVARAQFVGDLDD
jgi:hypothetical protein